MSLIQYNYNSGRSALSSRWHDDHCRCKDQVHNNHELIEAVKIAGRDRLSVTVIASDLAPAVESAYQAVVPAVEDYELEFWKFKSRYDEVRRKLFSRKKARLNRRFNQMMDERKKEFEALVASLAKRWSWLFGEESARAAAASKAHAMLAEKHKKEDLDRSLYGLAILDIYETAESVRYLGSAPDMPRGRLDAPAIRQLAETVRALPMATLTVPVETIQMIAKYASGANVIEREKPE